MKRTITLAALFLAGIAQAQIVVKNQGFVPFGDPPIHYRSEKLSDPIAKLQLRMDRGEIALDYEPGHGYLKGALRALGVAVNSQTLVFSKTSFQYPKISPEKPRALYFNDDVYVGQVHGGPSLEFVSFDPMQGAIFYILDEHQVERPRFERAVLDCIQCHVAPNTTRGVPGVMVRSVATRPTGFPVGGAPTFLTGHESPFKERWGGWYVTGSGGGAVHMGNATVGAAGDVKRVDGSLDTSAYLTDTSDLVAHLVLAHQTQMHNLITLTNYQTRLALKSGAGPQQYERPAEQLVRYLLFAGEAPLESPVNGGSGYAEEFAARGPRDRRGRSLRDFDLRTRIFKHPCSYLIYSEAFDAIPEPAKEYIYRRLFEVLSGREQDPAFASLSGEDRRAILEILVATKPNVPEEWKQYIKESKPLEESTQRGAQKQMNSITRNLGVALAVTIGASAGIAAENLTGRWAATTVQQGVTIPFRLDISGDGTNVTGTLFNGEDKQLTTSGSIQDGKLELNFDHYLVSILATVKDGELDGQILSRRGGPAAAEGAPAPRPGNSFHAKRYAAPTTAEAAKAPSIDGVWEIPTDSPKGEKAWRLIVKQKGSEITTTILRVDGDTGALTGGWQDGKFVASHFDGARPGLIVITPQADGTLSVNLNAGQRTGNLVAYRPEVARAKGLPEPANYQTHTTVRDPNEVFAFSFPDTNGKILSNEDPKFKGKVIVAVVTGTWCPNCHDEAQYLVELYAKYHSQGLEIVALDFEEPEQQNTLKRVNAFIKRYKVPYPYLIAGAPADMWDKVPQAVNLNTWPATLFIGKDGKVKATHSGFAAPASGIFHTQLREEFTSNIERLLKEQPVAVAAAR